MSDILGRLVTFLFGAVLLFIVPIMLIAVKQDDTKQTHLDDAVVEFVDNARAAGEITPDAYEQLTKRVDQAHQQCKIRMEYQSVYEYPVETTIDGINTYTFQRYLQSFNKEDITREMYPGGGNQPHSFALREGGYLHVDVTNITPTLGTKMLRLFLPGYAGRTLLASYGGYVGNNKQ